MADEELDTETAPDAAPDMSDASGPLDPKAILKQQIAARIKGINDKYETQYETLRSVSMPDESTINEDMAGELADLKEMYRAKNVDLHSAGGEAYGKKLPGLKASYHADQFRVKQKYDRQLRQLNRTYDQQKGMLQRQHQSEISAAEQRAIYDVGHMHAIDMMEQEGLVTSEQAQRARFKAAGLQLPAEPDPAQQFSTIDRIRGDVEGRLKKFSFGGKGGRQLMVVEQTDPTDSTTRENRPATQDEIKEWGQLERQKRSLTAKQIDIMASQGLLPKNVKDAYGYMGRGTIRSAAGRTESTGKSFTSIPKTRPPETAAPKKLDKATAVQLLKQAGGDKDKARQAARAMGYEL